MSRLWTEEEDRILRQMRRQAQPWVRIDEAIGRGHGCSQARWERIQNGIGETLPHRISDVFHVPAEVLQDRDRRARLAMQPRSFTAEFFGEPLPGYSALDRRKRENTDE